MPNMISLPNGDQVELPKINWERPDDLGWYADALQDVLPFEKLVSIQRWAFEKSETYTTAVDYWYAVLIATAAQAAQMDEVDFLLRIRSNPDLQKHLC